MSALFLLSSREVVCRRTWLRAALRGRPHAIIIIIISSSSSSIISIIIIAFSRPARGMGQGEERGAKEGMEHLWHAAAPSARNPSTHVWRAAV